MFGNLLSSPRCTLEDVLHKITTTQWEDIKLMAFDIANQNHLPYQERLQILRKITNRFVQLEEPVLCEGKEHLEQLKRQENTSLVLKKMDSYYHDDNNMEIKQTSFAKVVNIVGSKILCKTYDFPQSDQLFHLFLQVSSKGELVIKLTSCSADNRLVEFPFQSQITTGNIVEFYQEGLHLRLRKDILWKDILLTAHPYYVTATKSLGAIPKCRGCGKELLRDRPTLRVTVKFSPPRSGIFPGRISFCVDRICVELATQKYDKKGIKLPTFDGRVVLFRGM